MAQADAIGLGAKSPSPKELLTDDPALATNSMVRETMGGVRY